MRLPTCQYSLYCPLSWSLWWNQESYHTLSCGKDHMARNWRKPLVHGSWVNPVCEHFRELEGRCNHPKWSPKTAGRHVRTQATPDSWPKNMWANTLLKPPNVGVTCYTATLKDEARLSKSLSQTTNYHCHPPQFGLTS